MPSAKAMPMAHAQTIRCRAVRAVVCLLIVASSLELTLSTPNFQPPIPKEQCLGRWELGVGSWEFTCEACLYLELELRAELHEPPVEHLRRLSPPRVVGSKQRDRRVRVEDV